MEAQILSYLSPQYPWREEFRVLQTVGSTNDLVKELAAGGAPHGTVRVARQQTGGRGRRGRSFLSPPGAGVYLSILLRPNCRGMELMHLTCAVAVAMCDAVERAAGFRPGIKWTNDLVFRGKKLGGILTELSLDPQGLVAYAVIGVGINCCQQPEDFPQDLRPMASSLAAVKGAPVDPNRLAAAMMEALAKLDGDLLNRKSELLAQYRQDCVTLGKEISLIRGDEIRHGTALDVDDQGALVVAFPDGRVEAVTSGEVSVRGMYGYAT